MMTVGCGCVLLVIGMMLGNCMGILTMSCLIMGRGR